MLIELLWQSHLFRPLQKKSEITRLLEIVSSINAHTICEIGSAGGGTTFLLTQAAAQDAVIVTIDLEFSRPRQEAIIRFASNTQRVFCLEGNSHHPQMVREVRNCLDQQTLDVLYLDGDHSYEGIKTDFELYSPLVRPGGIIVFHDIVPDFKTRYGIETTSYVGGVPQFWNELKGKAPQVEEIIEDPSQDGYGIGIIFTGGEPGKLIPQ
ncbi:MAG TPA: class I SAM-dependent methyltransferase [Pyrinomonadaceae bacterium]|nr:class I SAM-dependent methyltransferase [Pyrinomonadaceae bacterium]